MVIRIINWLTDHLHGGEQFFSERLGTVRLTEHSWILRKDVVLAVQYWVYLVKLVISLVDTVQGLGETQPV